MSIEPAENAGNDAVLSIVGLCLELDRLAADVYTRIAASCPTDELKAFWQEMADEERDHAVLWERIQTAGRKQRLPPIFDDPEAVRESLERITVRMRGICEQWDAGEAVAHPFVLACRLELSMLHPAFATLFYLARAMLDTDFYTAYDTHLNRFIAALHLHCETTPELELLGETLQRLWNDNRLLSQYATHDELTGQLNRRGFWLLARQMAYFSQRNRANIAVLMFDIDDFRQVNERHGHLAGDNVLKSIAAAVQGRLRRSDVFGRYGGEEFIVLFSAITPDGLAGVARELCRSIEQLDVDGIRVTASFGGTQRIVQAEPEEELTAMIARADKLLYAAKHAGKNRFVLDEADA